MWVGQETQNWTFRLARFCPCCFTIKQNYLIWWSSGLSWEADINLASMNYNPSPSLIYSLGIQGEFLLSLLHCLLSSCKLFLFDISLAVSLCSVSQGLSLIPLHQIRRNSIFCISQVPSRGQTEFCISEMASLGIVDKVHKYLSMVQNLRTMHEICMEVNI